MYRIEVRKTKKFFDFYYFESIEKVFELIESIEKDFSIKFKGNIKERDITFLTCYNDIIEVIIVKCHVDLYSVKQVNKKIQELE